MDYNPSVRMLIELLYLSIVLVTWFQAQMLLRKGGPAQRTYALMLVGDGIAALAAFIASRQEEPPTWTGIVGAASIFGFVGLVMLPRTLAAFARRAINAGRLRLGMRLLELRELLQPGLGARQERDSVAAILDVREGRVDKALEALRAQRQAIDNPTVK